jgi:Spy/CpxP family protein refolding chaperone
MKTIRVLALGALLLVAGAISARAQGGASQQGQAARRPDRLLDNMMLTESQKAKIEGIMRKYQPDVQALMQARNSGGDRAENVQKLMALRERIEPEIRAVLTSDQQAIFDKNVAEQKVRMEQLMKQQ